MNVLEIVCIRYVLVLFLYVCFTGIQRAYDPCLVVGLIVNFWGNIFVMVLLAIVLLALAETCLMLNVQMITKMPVNSIL